MTKSFIVPFDFVAPSYIFKNITKSKVNYWDSLSGKIPFFNADIGNIIGAIIINPNFWYPPPQWVKQCKYADGVCNKLTINNCILNVSLIRLSFVFNKVWLIVWAI